MGRTPAEMPQATERAFRRRGVLKMEKLKLNAANIIAGSEAIDRLEHEVKIFVGIIYKVFVRNTPLGKMERAGHLKYETRTGCIWEIERKEKDYPALLTLLNEEGEWIYKHGPRSRSDIRREEIRRIHASLDDLLQMALRLNPNGKAYLGDLLEAAEYMKSLER